MPSEGGIQGLVGGGGEDHTSGTVGWGRNSAVP